MDELLKSIEAFKERLLPLIESLNLKKKEERLSELKRRMSSPDFWNDRKTAERLAQEASDTEKLIVFWRSAEKQLSDIEDIARADEADKDVNLVSDLVSSLSDLEQSVESKEVEAWLSGEHDQSPAILTIYSGAGGVDAQDWAEMLERMYLRFAESHNMKATILDRTAGQEAGIKNVTIRINGTSAYGYLKNEAGVHRLVRISPFDADKSRHTSFAMVEVLPELDELGDIEIPDDDVRIDVFRASGHGGQSVNTTDSAVRLTHTPTGITVVCQNERSQLQNKEQAWKMLLGKLEKYYQAKQDEERQLLRGEFTENAWGNQIRSYVLHPYKMVKDHRTKHESKNPDEVLEGDIMPFLEAEMRRMASEE